MIFGWVFGYLLQCLHLKSSTPWLSKTTLKQVNLTHAAYLYSNSPKLDFKHILVHWAGCFQNGRRRLALRRLRSRGQCISFVCLSVHLLGLRRVCDLQFAAVSMNLQDSSHSTTTKSQYFPVALVAAGVLLPSIQVCSFTFRRWCFRLRRMKDQASYVQNAPHPDLASSKKQCWEAGCTCLPGPVRALLVGQVHGLNPSTTLELESKTAT